MPRTVFLIAVFLQGACVFAASSVRGARLFETQQCVRCHSVNGQGGSSAPDLGRRIGRNHTPAVLTSTLWNHAPTMWAEMRRQGITPPALTSEDAADLFAYFYSARFFDLAGDAGRGKDAFARHRCAECHGLAEAKPGGAPAVVKWQALGSPVALAEAMWNHAKGMREQFAQRGFPWPRLTSQELTDILVFLTRHPSVRRSDATFEVSSNAGGEALFKDKGCLQCHQGELALPPRLHGKTINDIAVAMWNHAPLMTDVAGSFRAGEMSSLLSYLWADQFFAGSGSSARGRRVFRQKSCAGCHEGGQAARLSGDFNALRLTSALWSHGPTMLERMKQQGIDWPRFNGREMDDVIAYLKIVDK